MKLPFALFILALVLCDCNVRNIDDNLITTVQVIQSYGYPVEVHTVETKDGYLLEMHRIPPRVTNGTDPEVEKRRKFPIVYSNTLFGSSVDAVFLGPGRSLAFILSDLGFDIWLGNFRGNTYSRAHKYLSPDDKKFWDFSWHESGVYDLPAQIDYICNATKAEKVIVIGCSMGTTTFFVMASTLPEYNEKVEMSMMLGPIGYVKNVKSPFIRLLIPIFKIHQVFNEVFANGEFLRQSKCLQILSKFICTLNKIEEKLCISAVFLLVGADPEEFDEIMLDNFFKFYPAGYSLKGVIHYAQLVESGKFGQYDHGLVGNMQRYNSPTPPDYNVSAITARTYFYVAPNDYLGDPMDAIRLAKEIPGLQKLRMINRPKFNHLGFVLARHAKELVYDLVVKDIQTHLNDI